MKARRINQDNGRCGNARPKTFAKDLLMMRGTTSRVLLAAATLVALAACSEDSAVRNNAGTRAYDRAAGTDVSGAYPSQRDGTPSNPPGTAATRAYDRATGSDVSGAYPENKTR
jgi:hypothetical protein